jgi:hypothetical protein
MNLNNLKIAIQAVPAEQPVFIYVGVGTAAGMLNHISGRLELSNYHQFPPFVQDLRNRIPSLNLFLLLIDPQQENPPYLVRDFLLTASAVEPDYYQSNDKNLQVMVVRQRVYTDPDIRPGEALPANAVNVTETLRDLNAYAIQERASLLYHDFTGRRTAAVAEYFDYDFANEHLDQIVYAMSAREDHGCYFDLAQPTSYFPMRLQHSALYHQRPIVKMFNYYKFIANNSLTSIEAERLNYAITLQPLIDMQKNQVIMDISRRFKLVYMSILRQLYKYKMPAYIPESTVEDSTVEESTDEGLAERFAPPEFIPDLYLYENLPASAYPVYVGLLKNKEYDLLSDILLSFIEHQLDIYAFLTKGDLSGEEMLKFIMADEDPYKWCNNVNLFM